MFIVLQIVFPRVNLKNRRGNRFILRGRKMVRELRYGIARPFYYFILCFRRGTSISAARLEGTNFWYGNGRFQGAPCLRRGTQFARTNLQRTTHIRWLPRGNIGFLKESPRKQPLLYGARKNSGFQESLRKHRFFESYPAELEGTRSMVFE